MPKSKPHARRGADAAFAKAMARAEFGRFYCDDTDLREIRRSMARDKTRSETPHRSQPKADISCEQGKPARKGQRSVSRPIGVRERRTELKVGLARLRNGRKLPS